MEVRVEGVVDQATPPLFAFLRQTISGNRGTTGQLVVSKQRAPVFKGCRICSLSNMCVRRRTEEDECQTVL